VGAGVTWGGGGVGAGDIDAVDAGEEDMDMDAEEEPYAENELGEEEEPSLRGPNIVRECMTGTSLL
jgi:hypothetical protein